jgi:hypothetical protein
MTSMASYPPKQGIIASPLRPAKVDEYIRKQLGRVLGVVEDGITVAVQVQPGDRLL